MASRLRDEDVVERGLDQVERLDGEPGLVEGAHHGGDTGGAALELEQSRPSRLGSGFPKGGNDLLRAPQLTVADSDLQVRVADLGLERARSVLGDDPARDDPDAVGELVGLLQVLRGQEDRRARRRSAPGPPPRSPCG